MLRYALINLLRGVLTLFAVSVLVFFLARVTGDPLTVLTPIDIGPADRAALAEEWGLNGSLISQYQTFIVRAVQGDFGASFAVAEMDATELILQRLPATLQLGAAGLFLTLLVGVPLGVLSAVKRGTAFDNIAKGFATFGQSIPDFWLGIILIWVFAVNLGWTPTSGQQGIRSLILPAIVMAVFGTAALVRLFRSAMIETLGMEYIKLARLKGLSKLKVIWKHALKAAAIAPLTYFGRIVVALVTGATVVEIVFSWPGVGLLAYSAANARDFPVVQALALFTSGAIVLTNLTIDLLYAYIDPRVRLGARAAR